MIYSGFWRLYGMSEKTEFESLFRLDDKVALVTGASKRQLTNNGELTTMAFTEARKLWILTTNLKCKCEVNFKAGNSVKVFVN